MTLRTGALSALLLATATLLGCKHTPTEKERNTAQIHYDLALQAQQNGHPKEAYVELEKSIGFDPTFPESRNAMGILLHLGFGKHEDAIAHYRKAIELRPTFSEAKTNLANVFLDLARYDEAIALYEEALNDMLYATPYIAQGNLGWALYKKGNKDQAIENIRAAITTNPKFCLGFKNLGIIYDETGDVRESCRQFGRYRETCPETADAYLREGVCLAKTGQHEDAKKRFSECAEKATAVTLQDDCKRFAEQLH